MVLPRLGPPRTATMRMARSRLGTEMITSIARMMIVARMPRLNAAISPRSVPRATEATTTEKPMKSDSRAP